MIWPFNKTEKTEYKVPEFKGLKFGTLLYEPKDDITAYEVSLMLPMFITMYQFNRREYVERNNLIRHFREMDDASTSK